MCENERTTRALNQKPRSIKTAASERARALHLRYSALSRTPSLVSSVFVKSVRFSAQCSTPENMRDVLIGADFMTSFEDVTEVYFETKTIFHQFHTKFCLQTREVASLVVIRNLPVRKLSPVPYSTK